MSFITFVDKKLLSIIAQLSFFLRQALAICFHNILKQLRLSAYGGIGEYFDFSASFKFGSLMVMTHGYSFLVVSVIYAQ